MYTLIIYFFYLDIIHILKIILPYYRICIHQHRFSMATIQSKKSRGHKYWYIVESRRVNGKPRPIVLAYLGRAEDLLLRLQGLTSGLRIKSYSHGAVAALLKVAHTLDVCNVINQHINSPRPYMPRKPIRNNLTAGSTFLLAAIGRVCMPTSKGDSIYKSTVTGRMIMSHQGSCSER